MIYLIAAAPHITYLPQANPFPHLPLQLHAQDPGYVRCLTQLMTQKETESARYQLSPLLTQLLVRSSDSHECSLFFHPSFIVAALVHSHYCTDRIGVPHADLKTPLVLVFTQVVPTLWRSPLCSFLRILYNMSKLASRPSITLHQTHMRLPIEGGTCRCETRG